MTKSYAKEVGADLFFSTRPQHPLLRGQRNERGRRPRPDARDEVWLIGEGWAHVTTVACLRGRSTVESHQAAPWRPGQEGRGPRILLSAVVPKVILMMAGGKRGEKGSEATTPEQIIQREATTRGRRPSKVDTAATHIHQETGRVHKRGKGVKCGTHRHAGNICAFVSPSGLIPVMKKGKMMKLPFARPCL